MRKYEGKSVRKVRTHCAKLPDSVGFPGNMQGVTRKLTVAELNAQKRLGVFVIIKGKAFHGNLLEK
jgi:hypothetical protein